MLKFGEKYAYKTMIHLRLPQQATHRLPFYLAMEEWAAHTLPADDYFFCWRVQPTVICGRNQDMQAEVNMDYCRSHGIDVVRRRSGGGCVYADMDNWMFSYICPGNEVQATFARYTTAIAAMLQSLGIDARATGRNDIVANGRKVSGNAFYHLPDRCIVHGTMLFDLDTQTMSNVLTPSKLKLASKAVASVPARVTGLRALGLEMTHEQFERYTIDYICTSERLLTDADVAQIEAIEQSYYQPEFLTRGGKDGTPTTAATFIRRAAIEGVGEIEAVVTADDLHRIAGIELNGDFFLLADPGATLYPALKGVKTNAADLAAACEAAHPELTIANLGSSQLAELLTDIIPT